MHISPIEEDTSDHEYDEVPLDEEAVDKESAPEVRELCGCHIIISITALSTLWRCCVFMVSVLALGLSSLGSWAKHLTRTVPLSTQVYKWVM